MTPPLDRRDFLRTVAVVSAAGAVGALPRAASAAEPAYDRTLPTDATYPVAAELLPFGHGVMSGDPLHDRVMLWTRVTIPDPRGFDATKVADPQGIRQVTVDWVLARDVALTDVVRRGTVRTDAARDWTVKVDADHLPSASTLYYAFVALGYRSLVGRTRTAPLPDADVGEVTIAHLACTSWWQDLFNTYGRIADRDDLDLVTHAGDHIYDSSGGHPASRFWKGQRSFDTDIDNRDFTSVYECRRRYALYYADPQLLRAHAAAPFAIMPDQHDDDPGENLTSAQARSVVYEWTAMRTVLPDGSGRFAASPGPNVNVPIPQGDSAAYFYRVLPYGRLTDIVLLDVRRFADVEGQESQVLGDRQWTWLQGALLASQARGATFRYVVNQVNLSQLRAFNLPLAEQFRQQFGIDTAAPQGEIYTTAWGGHPQERVRLLRFLRENDLIDNVVMSGDSHGFFGYDLVEDAQAPNYEPATGGGLLGAVGVELVPSAQGRPGGQDVLAEQLYFSSMGCSRGAAFEDAATYDAVYRPAALQPTMDIEVAARAANPNLLYFNWKAEFGYTMVHLRPERAVLECWTTPQRVRVDEQRLLAQFASPVGAPHLGQVLQPEPVQGSRQSRPAPEARVTRSGPSDRAPSATPADAPAATAATRAAGPDGTSSRTGRLPATGAGPATVVVGTAAVAASLAAARLRRSAPAHEPPSSTGRPQGSSDTPPGR